MRMYLLLVWVLGLVLGACNTPPPVPPATTPPAPTPSPSVTPTPAGATFHPGPCTFRKWLAVDTTCGTLTVPEDHQQPGGRQIKLAVAILKSSSGRPAPDPVVFLQGGPGLSVFTNQPELYMPSFDP